MTLVVKCRMSVDFTILTTMIWEISQYEWEYKSNMLCMEKKVAA